MRKNWSLKNRSSFYVLFFFIKIGRFTAFGGSVPTRPAEDLAFSVARFIAKGGSFVNYYMVSIKMFILEAL